MPSPDPAGGLVGRWEARVLVDEVVGELERGHGGVLIVAGDAGIGKTTLVGEAIAKAAAKDVRTLVGQAREIDRGRPFGAIADLVENARRDGLDLTTAAGALRPVEHVTMADRTLVVADAVADGVEPLAMGGGVLVVVVVEDLHWADAGTLGVLRGLVGVARIHPVLIVVTTRPEPARRDVELLLDDLVQQGARSLGLLPLDEDAVDALVTERLGRLPGSALRVAVAGCGGNPFYVVQLLTALDQEGDLEVSGEHVEIRADASPVPPSLRATIVRHLGFLPRETVRVLQIAALLGEAFAGDDLAAVAGRSMADVLALLEPAVRSGFVVESGDRWAFQHDLVRQALEAELAPPARVALHRQAADALDRAGAPPLIVARHLVQGAQPGDRDAVARLRAAAAEALRSSIAAGIDLLQAALALTSPADPERAAIVAELVTPLNASGRSDEVEAIAGTAVGRLDRDAEVTITQALASVHYTRGDIAPALDVLVRLADRPDLTPAQRTTVQSSMAIFSLVRLDLDTMATFAERALASAAATDDHFAVGLASNTMAMCLLAQGRAPEAELFALRAREHVVAGSVYSWQAYSPPFTVALVAIERDDFPGALASLARGRVELEACGNVSWLVQYGAVEPLIPYLAGDLDGTEDACRVAQSLRLDIGPRYQLGVPSALLSLVATRRGDVAAAAAHAEAAERHYLEHGPQLGIDAAWMASALAKEAQGDGEGAFETLRAAWELAHPIHALLAWRLLAPSVARLGAERDRDFARVLSAHTAEFAERNPVPSALGTAALADGLARGDADRVMDAVALFRESPRRLDAADAATEAVRLLRAAGRGDEAAATYEYARQRYETAGALGDLDRLRRAAGRRRRGVVPRPMIGWASLTRTEREVVALLQDGLTNRQIGEALGISRRTVETHLSHAFTKVGVTTRVQLAASAARQR